MFKQAVGRVLAASLAMGVVLPLIAGCSSKEETPKVSGGTYYTGPMKKKSEASGADAASQPGKGADTKEGN